MLTHIIVPASSTIGEFFDRIFPDAGCLLNSPLNAEQATVRFLPTSWKEMVKSSSSLISQRRVTYLKDTLL